MRIWRLCGLLITRSTACHWSRSAGSARGGSGWGTCDLGGAGTSGGGGGGGGCGGGGGKVGGGCIWTVAANLPHLIQIGRTFQNQLVDEVLQNFHFALEARDIDVVDIPIVS